MYLEINKILRNVSLTGLLSVLLLSSCQDGLEGDSARSRQLRFTVVKGDGWHSSRAEALPRDTVQLLQGCDDAEPLYLHTLYTDSIASPSSSTDLPSRATPVTGDNMYESFGVSAYCYSDSWDETKLPNYFYNVTATKQGDSYGLAEKYFWPGSSHKLKFFAYAPIDNPQYLYSESTQAGAPTINVTIPGDVAQQQDLLVAQTGELTADPGSAVPLPFNHALTAVKFVCGDDMKEGIVKSITLRNVYSTGTYNMGTETWSSVATPATFSQTLDLTTTGTPGEAITTDAQTFMMMPQTLPTGAQLEVQITYSSVDYTLTSNIAGTEWPLGKTVTYKVSTSTLNWEYTFDVVGPDDFTYEGGTKQYSVASYRTNSARTTEPVPWTTQFSEDGGETWTDTKPSWLTTFTSSGVGTITRQSFNVILSAQIPSIDPHTVALQNAVPKGTETTPYNLANQTDGGATDENTANCYVVNAPGYYSFPLVYGNAIKYGAANTSAYTSNASGSTILRNFINHTGKAITDPYITKNVNCVPAKAELVWQDEPNLVTDIKYNDTDNGNISFKVDRATVRQGNAVIAIKNASNQIMWSWHIWVTDEDLSKTNEITNYQKYKYKIMPVPVGFCSGDTTKYAERICNVRFKAGYMRKEMTITQSPHIETTPYNAPFFQFGRKDPFRGWNNGRTYTSKTWYNAEGTQSTRTHSQRDLARGNDAIKNYILNPTILHSFSAADNTYTNLWSLNNNSLLGNDIFVYKTIYDSSPVGFKVPPGNVFTGFTKTGNNTSSGSQFNGTWNEALNIWHVYTNASKTNTFPIYCFSQIHYVFNTPGTGLCKGIVYWTASANCVLMVNRNSAYNPLQPGEQGNADTVFPIEEQ